jgi:isochorismate hydrolase
MRPNQLDADRAFVLAIDVQAKLLPHIRRRESLVAAALKLLEGTRIFELPVIATEQYPKGIGATDESLRPALLESRALFLQKLCFSAWAEDAVRQAIVALDRPQAIVFGIEAHVCVQQSVLDLVSRDHDVFVCGDAIGSRGAADYEASLARMRQEGAWVTTAEAVLFELCQRCDTGRVRALSQVIKARPPDDMPRPATRGLPG